MHARPPRLALLEMIGGATLISTTSIFVRLADVGPTVSAFYRVALGGLFLLGGLIVLRRWQAVRWLPVLWLALPAAAFAVDLMMWHRSILLVGPGLATLLGNFQVFVMAVAGWWLYREHLGWRFLAGVVLALLGLYLLVGVDWSAHGAGFRLGIVLGLTTGIAYAVYMLSTRHIQRRGHAPMAPAQLLCVQSLVCALMLAVAAGTEGESFAIPDFGSLAALAGLALVGQIFGWILLLRAMPHLPASLIGLLLLLQPALSFVLDVILFARPTSLADWVGIGVSMAGIFIGSWRASSPSSSKPEPA